MSAVGRLDGVVRDDRKRMRAPGANALNHQHLGLLRVPYDHEHADYGLRYRGNEYLVPRLQLRRHAGAHDAHPAPTTNEEQEKLDQGP